MIIGFGTEDISRKQLFDYDTRGRKSVSTGTARINPYLIVGTATVITARSSPICKVPPMIFGTKLVDDGHFVLNSDERTSLLSEYPQLGKYIRPFAGGDEFLNGTIRYVLWLGDAPSELIRNIPPVLDRVERVRRFRAASKKGPTVELAAIPKEPGENRQPETDYLLVPKVSSERRTYMPLGFISRKFIANGSSLVVPDGELYHLGVMSSSMHMAWMRQVCGRMKSDYQYSATLVYNNYPWPEPDAKQRAAIEAAAQAVLDARTPHLERGASLADLYDPLAMPAELLKAHQALDRAVDKSYRAAAFTSDRERVEFLFVLYEKLTAPLAPAAPPKPKRAAKLPLTTAAAYPTQADLDAGHIYAKEDPPTEK